MSISKFFTSDTDTLRVDLDDGQWVDIKRSLNSRDQDLLAQAQMDVEIEIPQNDPRSRAQRRRDRREGKESNIKSAKMKSAISVLLEIIIVRWSFVEDETGAPIPITPEWIGKLKVEWANKIQDEWDEESPLQD